MPDWGSMSEQELNDFCKDNKNIEAEPDSERDKLQEELCKRFKWRWELPDGSVGYEPPDWRGG